MAFILGDVVCVAFYTGQPFSRHDCFRASGAAILGTLKHFCSCLRRGDFRYTEILFNAFYDEFVFRASGEAI